MSIDESFSGTDSFEALLHQKDERMNRIVKHEKEVAAKQDTDTTEYTRATKGATLTDFFEMVKKMVLRVMKKDKVEFYPDDWPATLLDPGKDIEHPYIFYTLISRQPRQMNNKPIFREDFKDRNRNGTVAQQGAIYGQFFDCEVQFNIVASDYSLADKVMDTFEDAMVKYSGYFKKNGVSELFFKKQYTDSSLEAYRKKMSVRSLVYWVAIERIRLAYDSTITEIIQSKEDN